MRFYHHETPLAHALRLGGLATYLVVCLLIFPAHADSLTSDSTGITQPTKAGIMATEESWSLAEMTGDTAFLDQMLLPEYRSVSHNGTSHSKADIIADAATRRGTDPTKAKRELADYHKEHPSASAVVMRDNIAIVTFYDSALGEQKGTQSADVFVYTDGHWHAMYSQHAEVGKS